MIFYRSCHSLRERERERERKRERERERERDQSRLSRAEVVIP